MSDSEVLKSGMYFHYFEGKHYEKWLISLVFLCYKD